jgi:peptidoglycan/xylan/chitin deacetylase (PgdA/CDA1 family)
MQLDKMIFKVLFKPLFILGSFFMALTAANKIEANSCWPNGEQLVISFSMQFEAGGQPEGAESPFSGSPLPKEYPDLPARTWFAYGYKEGIGRMLNLWDKHNIKVTSHIVGEAAIKNPNLAKAIADKGHEIAAHGMRWDNSYDMSYEDETKFIKDGVDAVEKITGKKATGYNANWLRRSKNTLKILQDLGFFYHIDDVSRDQPFVVMVRGKKFAVVPYTLRNNDIVLIEGKHFSADQFLNQLKLEFDRLYAEGKTECRMMSVSLHDRIGGTPAIVQAVDQFIEYAKQHKGVAFMRKDQIAQIVLNQQNPLVDDTEIEFNQ